MSAMKLYEKTAMDFYGHQGSEIIGGLSMAYLGGENDR